ncbi:DNA-binding response regulator [Bacillus pseudomycoides]|uniref:Response regulator transcription factor n=1 Tax=Bacillus pseudomycoides TaxID=64104 RepID=A0AAJ3RB56_9BACI|nr:MULTISPECIES: response regulator transcription factor [Bacillus cereus group]EEM06526.1 DNA-binding response regulator [Bacillus pseudomycoides]EEM12345.1 DNA-binding response regulator [Bacillus pseudomycoides]MBD5800340.1 DNA-binding response regulator [Bacillus pseudomycoides]MBJ8030457.1 response regulator transcription factor [Bacillus cereus group sp. N21]MCR8855890.1 response regulator transcription factor [Bacillus pseudomycoides]
MGLTILHIEDDKEIGLWVSEFFTERGYKVIWLKSGHHAFEYMEQTDVVIMDIMLPGLDGYTVGQRMKQKFPEIPIMMLTARASIEDKLQGLAFADDYMTKPYHPDELEARIHVLLRRLGVVSPDHIQLNHLSIDRKANRILSSQTNKEIVLTGKQFHIFMFLFNHPNQILTQKQIYEAVWEDSYIKGDRTLMVHIRHLREKIEIDPSHPQIIETIRGIGYRLKL